MNRSPNISNVLYTYNESKDNKCKEAFLGYCLNAHQRETNIRTSMFFLEKCNFWKRCKENGINVYYSSLDLNKKKVIKWFIFQFYFFFFLKSHKVSIVHSTCFSSYVYCLLPTLLLRIKSIYLHHTPLNKWKEILIHYFPIDLIYFSSEYILNKHAKVAGRPSTNFRVISLQLAVENNIINSQKIKTTYGKNTKLILVECSYESKIGVDSVIKALGLLMSKKIKLKLIILGNVITDAGLSYFYKLEKLIDELNLEQNVHFIGGNYKISDYIAAADIFVECKSVFNAFLSNVKTALALKTYVIAVEDEFLVELLNHEDRCIYKKKYPAEGISQCIQIFLKQKYLTKKVIKKEHSNTASILEVDYLYLLNESRAA